MFKMHSEHNPQRYTEIGIPLIPSFPFFIFFEITIVLQQISKDQSYYLSI